MAYETLRRKVDLSKTSLKDRYGLISLPLTQLREMGFSREDPLSLYLECANGGRVIFHRQGEIIFEAEILGRKESQLNQAHQNLLQIAGVKK